MKSAPLLIELHYLPCLEYFCLMLTHQQVFLEAHESYVKGSYRNKARIITANGTQTLSVPLTKGKHQQKNIQSVEIANETNWRIQHWKSIKTAYQSAPYWDDYAMEIEPLCVHEASDIWSYNLQWLKGIIDILQLDLELKYTDTYVTQVKEDRVDLRHRILPKLKTYYSPNVQTIKYEQVFADRQPFIPNACILDLLFCKGPETSLILEDMII